MKSKTKLNEKTWWTTLKVVTLLLVLLFFVVKLIEENYNFTQKNLNSKQYPIPSIIPTETPNNCPDGPNVFKGKTKIEILRAAFNDSVINNNELNKIGETYDLACYGKTDVDISETISNQAVQENISDDISKKCQEDQVKYNSCLTEYNTKMLEYQNCLNCKANNGFGCEISCIEPHNSCGQYKSEMLCN